MGKPSRVPLPSPGTTVPNREKGRPSIAAVSSNWPAAMAERMRLLLILSPVKRTGSGLSSRIFRPEHHWPSRRTSPERFFPNRQFGPTETVFSEGNADSNSPRKSSGACRARVALNGRVTTLWMPQVSRIRNLWGRPVIRAGCFSGCNTESG